MELLEFKITFQEKKKKNPLTRVTHVFSRSMYEARGALLSEHGKNNITILTSIPIDEQGREIYAIKAGEDIVNKEGVEVQSE